MNVSAPARLSQSLGLRRPSRRELLIWVGLPLLIALLSWEPLNLGISPGIDPSWAAAMELALRQHVHFGDQLTFTYGPLGFLNVADFGGLAPGGNVLGEFLWFGNYAGIAYLYTLISRVALCAAVFAGARRSFGVAGGALVALVVLRSGQFADLPVLLIALVWALDTSHSRRVIMTVCAVGGGVAAIELLEKFSTGIPAFAMMVLFAAALPNDRKRAAGLALGGFVSVLVVGWLITGQSLGQLPAFLHASEQLAAGYSDAMQLPASAKSLLLAIAVALFGLWGAWLTTAKVNDRQRVGVILLWLCFAFATFKEGFVRADGPHMTLYFAAALDGLIAFHWRRGREVVGLIAVAVGAYACLWVNPEGRMAVFDLPQSVSATFNDARDLLSPSTRAAIIAHGRADLIKADAVPPQALALLRGKTVDVLPTETAIVWAYRLNWRPLPVFQSYYAVTPWLDRLNAEFVNSERAPSRILLQAGEISIDNRLISFDEPLTTVAILCHYELLLTSPSYAVLGRIPDRCSGERLIATVHANWNQTVNVPAPSPDSMVLARISGVQVHGLESLRGLVYQSPIRGITLNPPAAPNRLLAAVAGDGLPLLAAGDIDYPAPFSTSLGVKALAVNNGGNSATGNRPITFRFYALTVKPVPAG